MSMMNDSKLALRWLTISSSDLDPGSKTFTRVHVLIWVPRYLFRALSVIKFVPWIEHRLEPEDVLEVGLMCMISELMTDL